MIAQNDAIAQGWSTRVLISFRGIRHDFEMANTTPPIYTRGGDKGKTSLIGGTRVSKGDLRLEAYGTIDELNSCVGVLRAEMRTELPKENQASLEDIQRELFDVGSQLACEDLKVRERLPSVSAEEITRLEREMDTYSALLKPLKNFVLPGGSRAASVAHLARTICRRAERSCVRLAELDAQAELPGGAEEVPADVMKYINRLSDYFFVLARHLNRVANIEEPIWSAKTDRQDKKR